LLWIYIGSGKEQATETQSEMVCFQHMRIAQQFVYFKFANKQTTKKPSCHWQTRVMLLQALLAVYSENSEVLIC